MNEKLVNDSYYESQYLSRMSKPEYEFFKVGDWINVDGDLEILTKIDYKKYIKDPKYLDGVELWQPTEGEWCWSKYDGLVNILSVTDGGYLVFPLSSNRGDCATEYKLGGLEPFIGQLPSWIKDKQ